MSYNDNVKDILEDAIATQARCLDMVPEVLNLKLSLQFPSSICGTQSTSGSIFSLLIKLIM